ncbi:FlgO family outer membrane protein [Lacimicrobium alkaliphilum]|uniref:FlgO domain-containing protein n=1 Tax=Lacimicrobium alkaliphilum TaxID=1526571 RepID=A0ABQ1R287_9ALTE|nr:FlgO family outer membrane protein [Lacimicrobium alkaliphilum]GGD55520.1 hypothetical protein GCM10011357_08930 [Lacimicrobium alkaliphilum]
MKSVFLITLSVVLLSACQSLPGISTPWKENEPSHPQPQPNLQQEKAWGGTARYNQYSPQKHFKALNDYAQQLVHKFQEQHLDYNNESIAITSFVEFDDNLKTTNTLGNQFAEALLTEMSSLGYQVVDVKTDEHVQVTQGGDFIFSREIKRKEQYCCIVAGTLIYEHSGVRVNGRVIDRHTQKVMSASSVVIPYFVIKHLGSAEYR